MHQNRDPKLGWWSLPRGQLMDFPLGMHRIGQDEGMFAQVLYPVPGLAVLGGHFGRG